MIKRDKPNILILHDTDLNTPRGAELTIKEIIQHPLAKAFEIKVDPLKNFEVTQKAILVADVVILNSSSLCLYEIALIDFLIQSKKVYIKVEYDYNFCVRRNVLCLQNSTIRNCCNTEKYRRYRQLFLHAAFSVFQSPKHLDLHQQFYGAAIHDVLIMPPNVQLQHLNISSKKRKCYMPFFGDLNKLKGGDALVDFALEHPEYTCEVFGSNKLHRTLPKNIVFMAQVDNKKVLKILGETEALLCKPVWPEPSGRLAAEAFLSGCQLITNENLGTAYFDFYPNHPEQAKLAIAHSIPNFWEKVSQAVSQTTTKTTGVSKEKAVYVCKSYGGLGDIFFSIPAVLEFQKAYEIVYFGVEKRLIPFFQKHLPELEIVDVEDAYKNNDYPLIELGNYPAFRGYDYPNALTYITSKKVKQHAINHYLDAVARLNPRFSNEYSGYPYFKKKYTNEHYYVVHPGAGFLLKVWPKEKYAALIKSLAEVFPKLHCKIIQGPNDPDLSPLLPSNSLNISFVTGDLEAVGDALAGAQFFIGNDAGITHVAGAYNLPIVGIYGPTGPGSWGCFSENNEIIWGKNGVCTLRCNYDVIMNCAHRICLTSVNVERVMEALYTLLHKSISFSTSQWRINPSISISSKGFTIGIKKQTDRLDIACEDAAIYHQLLEFLTSAQMPAQPHNDFNACIQVLVDQNIAFKTPSFN
ncbi:MAG: glycosyltransferase family 9 protein [Flavobacteriaceae bacterium]|nr:glycosyltransferase family 9 protein [Flavobacteriaceae bacterium]